MDRVDVQSQPKEYDNDKDIEFPLYDVSEYGWNEFSQKEHNIIFQNPYAGIVPYQKKRFADRLKQYEFMDCRGNVFRVQEVHFIKPGGVRGFFSLSSVIDLKFHPTGRTITFEEFRELIKRRSLETNNMKLQEAAAAANSISELLKPL